MPSVTDLTLPRLEYFDPRLRGPRFHEVLHGLAADGWLAEVEGLGYVVLDRAGVDALLRTRAARMPAIEILELQGVTGGPMHRQLSGNLINLQGEEHRRLRGLVQPAFAPRAAEGLRPAMRAHVTALLDAVDADGCEVVAEVAKPYPARMIAEIVGAPVSDADRLGEWAYWIQATFDPIKVSGDMARIEAAADELDRYVRALLGAPGAGPTDDLLATLRPALAAGELSEDQCVALVGSVLVGGVDTTQSQLSHAVRLFAEHPDQWAALVADPTLVRAAVDEVLRFEPIAPFTARLTTQPLTLHDVGFPEGTVLFACATTANRDPSAYTAPERFDITADRGDAKPLTFGAGPHFCLGAALARAELEVALEAMAQRWSAIELLAEPHYDTPAGVYGLQALPVRLQVAA